jgi:hypothetical protein
MLSMDDNILLDSKKAAIGSSVAFQNANKDNPNYLDITGSLISIFGYEIRQKINFDARRCNKASGEILISNPEQNYDRIINLCNGVNKYVSNLQSTVSWAQKTGEELLNFPGLSDLAKTSCTQTMKDTIETGNKAITSSASIAGEAMNMLSTKSDTPANVEKTAQATNYLIDSTINSSNANLNNDKFDEYSSYLNDSNNLNNFDTKTNTNFNTDNTEADNKFLSSENIFANSGQDLTTEIPNTENIANKTTEIQKNINTAENILKTTDANIKQTINDQKAEIQTQQIKPQVTPFKDTPKITNVAINSNNINSNFKSVTTKFGK